MNLGDIRKRALDDRAFPVSVMECFRDREWLLSEINGMQGRIDMLMTRNAELIAQLERHASNSSGSRI